ncbi:hypothetical protein ACEN9J_37370 [Variovorax sp. Varisp41]|uniref:hypothetical protein n=1 Tax=Variovorax sp. Varisp41 TaxID=3243033 RepID=UPI0039B584F7
MAEFIDEGFCVIRPIFNDQGVGVDYTFLEVNRRFETETGLRQAIGRRMYELAPAHEPFWAEPTDASRKPGCRPDSSIRQRHWTAGMTCSRSG